jgi:hypothetical protein
VEKACTEQLRAWEEAARLREPLKNKKLARSQSFFIGIGARVIAYKKHMGIKNLSTATALSMPVTAKSAPAKPAPAKDAPAKDAAAAKKPTAAASLFAFWPKR